jgi:hypothetical protein
MAPGPRPAPVDCAAGRGSWTVAGVSTGGELRVRRRPAGGVEIAEGRPEALTRRRPSPVRGRTVPAGTRASEGPRRPARRTAPHLIMLD